MADRAANNILIASNELHFEAIRMKTAYEIGVRLVGSEMCIRDRLCLVLSLTGFSDFARHYFRNLG